MANLFKGFKQVLGTTYAEAVRTNAAAGYIWFVRTVVDDGQKATKDDKNPDGNLTNDEYDIYFGTKHYGHFQKGEINGIQKALADIKTEVGLGDNYAYSSTEDLIKGANSVSEAIDLLAAKVKDDSATLSKLKTDTENELKKRAVDIIYTANDSELKGPSQNHASLKLKMADGTYSAPIDVQDFVVDGILESAELVTDPDKEHKGTFIKLVFNQEGSGEKDPIYLDVKGLIDVYTAADETIVIEGNEVKVGVVPAAQTETKKAITVKGGPLADLLNSKGINQIDANTNMQALLEKLFFEELWPSASKTKFTEEPFSVYFNSIGATLTNSDKTVEVGTKVTASAKTGYAPSHNTPERIYSGFSSTEGGYGYATSLEGEVKSGNPASVSATGFTAKKGTFKMTRSIVKGFTETDKINKTSSDASYSQVSIPAAEDLIVNAGENKIKYTISGPGFTGNIPSENGEYFAASNVGNLSNEHKIARGAIKNLDANPSEKSQTLTVTGVRKGFYGTSTGTIDLTSDGLRGLTSFDNTKSLTISIPADTITVVIALPTSWSYNELSKVLDKEAFGTDVAGSFILSNVDVEGANKYTPESYNVYTFVSGKKLKKNTYDVTFK